jgi:hypothetical protein
MRVRPAVAAELLLAIIIEDSPEEEYGTSRFRDNVGLARPRQSLVSDRILEESLLLFPANRPRRGA